MDLFSSLQFSQAELSAVLLGASRLILPVLTLWLLARCVRSLLRERYEPETWAYVGLPDGENLPIRHWECILGRSASADLVLPYSQVSRSHAALMRGTDGQWRLFDLGSAGGTMTEGFSVPPEGAVLRDCQDFTLSGVELRFIDLNEAERENLEQRRTRPGRVIHPGLSFLLLTVIQAVLALEHSLSVEAEYLLPVTLAFGALAVVEWLYYFIMRAIGRLGFEVETLAFFLSTVGLSVAATSVPYDMVKQTVLLLAGIVLFLFLGWWLRDLERAKRFRWAMGFAALGLLGLNLLLSEAIFGAKNWLQIGGVSFQPSEFVKIAYIYAGTATLDRLFMGRNLFLYIAFSAVCVGALALMGDFGTALIFFATFLVISFLRSGNLATVFLAITGAGLAGFLVVTVKPYITQRFATWGHVWEYANDAGYQQTRAMSAAASGGLFGMGGGRGWLEDIVAADTDMVFAVVCEELGLLIALAAVAALLILAFAAVRNAATGRSSFYVIAGCAAASMLLVQMGLNVFGSLDILPFTGVTFPFLSRGGSSLISCWALLAFIKAGDTRSGASFVMKSPGRYADAPEPEPEDYQALPEEADTAEADWEDEPWDDDRDSYLDSPFVEGEFHPDDFPDEAEDELP